MCAACVSVTPCAYLCRCTCERTIKRAACNTHIPSRVAAAGVNRQVWAEGRGGGHAGHHRRGRGRGRAAAAGGRGGGGRGRPLRERARLREAGELVELVREVRLELARAQRHAAHGAPRLARPRLASCGRKGVRHMKEQAKQDADNRKTDRV